MPQSLEEIYNAIGGDAVLECWSAHCDALGHSCTPTDGVVGDLFAQFHAVLETSPLQAPVRPPYPATFVVDLALTEILDRHTVAATVQMPSTVLPVLEFLRSVVDLFARLTAYRQQHPNTPPSQSEDGSQPKVPDPPKFKPLSVVVRGAPPMPFSSLGAANLGILTAVTGTVVRLSNPRIQCTRMAFKCAGCSALVRQLTDNGVLIYPSHCGNGKCKSYSFTPMSQLAECTEVQTIKIQEATAGGTVEPTASGSNSNRMVEVELVGSLMDSVVAGDVVTVCGVVSARRSATGAPSFGGAGSSHQICSIKARSLESTTLLGGGGLSVHSHSEEAFDAGQFFEMANHPRWFNHLTNAIAPSIYGHENVKAALVLALLGGCERPFMRGAIHLLMVGDPGMGKSQMLRACCAAAPRGVFVCANTSSSCGLTVTLSRDPQTGETTFEAGAVVHGDGGVSCIDEIDKGMAREHESLLEVMEQQSVSIAKAGMIFSMPIHSTIVAAGNPKNGRFDPRLPLSDNIGLPAALLSRFDFILLLKDKAQSATSEGLTAHVLDMHVAGGMGDQHGGFGAAMGGGAPAIDASTVGRFVAFAKKVCHPTLSPEASQLIEAAYLQARAKAAANPNELPVTPRQLQAMIRITEARARAELKPVATADHARYALDLLDRISSVYREEANEFAGVTRPKDGKKKDQKGEVLDRLRMMLNRTGNTLLKHEDIIDVCVDVGVKNPENTLKGLHDNGYLLSAAGGKFKLMK